MWNRVNRNLWWHGGEGSRSRKILKTKFWASQASVNFGGKQMVDLQNFVLEGHPTDFFQVGEKVALIIPLMIVMIIRVKHQSLSGFRKNLQCSLNQGKNKEMTPHMSFLMSWLIFKMLLTHMWSPTSKIRGLSWPVSIYRNRDLWRHHSICNMAEVKTPLRVNK